MASSRPWSMWYATSQYMPSTADLQRDAGRQHRHDEARRHAGHALGRGDQPAQAGAGNSAGDRGHLASHQLNLVQLVARSIAWGNQMLRE
jgi:hypothetical protein